MGDTEKHVGIEDPVEVGAEGATYLGCRQVLTKRKLPNGDSCTVMEWDMQKFLESCLDKYKELAQVKEIRPAPTPFLTEDQSNAPSRAAGKRPLRRMSLVSPCVSSKDLR